MLNFDDRSWYRDYDGYKLQRRLEMTRGQYRVGVNFNPSGDQTVYKIKQMAADLIDAVDLIVPPNGSTAERHSEVARLRALAVTHIEDAAMWAVKAATKAEPT